MKNRLLLDALRCQNNAGRPPVWLMRQAGRYMPEYRALRAKYPFLSMCHQPELIAQVTALPIEQFGMDAAILFSDILILPEAFDIGLRFEEKVGPIIEKPFRCNDDLHRLQEIDVPSALSFVADGVRAVKERLNEIPLIGFCGAPFTVASYLIEGGSSKDFKKTKQWMMNDPDGFHRFLERLTELSIDYLQMQVNAGVDALQVFDSWTHILAPPHFSAFSVRYLSRIVDHFRNQPIPVILFGKAFGQHVEEVAALCPSAISLDWNCRLNTMRSRIDRNIALQGNLDPQVLYADAEVVKSEVVAMLRSMDRDPGYIFNLGHGILPDIPPDNVRLLVDLVRDYH